jgi:CDP-4-dehydro-6-deoxyglucose reductase, E1
MKIPMAVDTWGVEERNAIRECMRLGQYTMGERVKVFEEAYAKYCGTKYCVAVNSGSSANLLMVAAHTLRHGKGTVIVPAVGWATSYAPYQQYGWRMVFVDIDRYTLNYDIEQLRDAVREYRPDAILAINLLGNPNEFDEFPNGIPIHEDNCESMGAKYMGRVCGSFGTMGTHSTFYSHHICTMEGGLITTDDVVYRDMLLALRSHGWTRHLDKDNSLGAKVDKFHFILPGYNVRPIEMQGAIGLEQLDKLDTFVAQRRENAERFPYRTQKETTGGESSWFGFAVFGDDRAKVTDKFDSRPVVTGNFLRQPVIKHFNYEVFGTMRNADYIHDNAIMIGNSHEKIDWENPKAPAPYNDMIYGAIPRKAWRI